VLKSERQQQGRKLIRVSTAWVFALGAGIAGLTIFALEILEGVTAFYGSLLLVVYGSLYLSIWLAGRRQNDFRDILVLGASPLLALCVLLLLGAGNLLHVIPLLLVIAAVLIHRE
jgi:hypothetical protein